MRLETDRLILREWDPVADVDKAFAIYGDAEVTRFLGDGTPCPTPHAMALRLAERTAVYETATNGQGFWAIERKSDLAVLGSILLKPLPNNEGRPSEDWEVGWHLARAAWGHGYAAEGGGAALRYGFEFLRLPVIYAVVKPENVASVRVTERLAMKPLGLVERYYNVPLLLFEKTP